MAAMTAIGAALVLAPGRARADPDDTPPTLQYRQPQQPHRLRAIGEEVLVLGAGFGEYVLDKSNSRDFDLKYDWPSLRSKLLFESIAFDNNRFATNFATHPIAGWFYYGVARSNRLSMGESFGYAFVASWLWETFGEWREQAAINDIVFTPVSGVPIGESLFHLGALFQRSRNTSALAWLFGPLKSLNDTVDGAEPAPADGFDDLGLPTDVWHHFHFSAGAGVTAQDHGLTQADGRVAIGSRIVALPSYGKRGEVSRWFDEGEVSTIGFEIAGSKTGVTDALFETAVMPFGYYDHHSTETTIVGMDLGFEYGVHDYDRDRRRDLDRISYIDAGLGLEHAMTAGAFRMRARFAVLGDFGGVDAYAMPEHRATLGDFGVPSVLANEAYYFAIGTTVRPQLELAYGALHAGGDVKADWFQMIRALDRDGPSSTVTATDQRFALRAFLGLALGSHVAIDPSIERRIRAGRVGTSTSSRGETTAFVTTSILF
jgi:hypothetical protein